MAWPENTQVTSTIIHDDFFSTLEKAETQRFYPKLTEEKTQDDITATYTSMGSVPEPHQMSGTLGGGPQQAAILKDWILAASVVEWDNTIYFRRLVAKSQGSQVRSRVTRLAEKAQKFMDKSLLVACASSTAGYDGVAAFSTAHPESGANQTNTSSTVAATGTNPTAAEMETALITATGQLLGIVDDQGTPVCEGVTRFAFIVHPTMAFTARTVVSPLMSNQAVDASGVTGRFRGLVDVYVSAYCTSTGATGGTVDRAFLFADPGEVADRAFWLCRLEDWMFSDNIDNENSDLWNQGQGYARSWAAHIFMPGNWQVAQRLIWT